MLQVRKLIDDLRRTHHSEFVASHFLHVLGIRVKRPNLGPEGGVVSDEAAVGLVDLSQLQPQAIHTGYPLRIKQFVRY